MRKIDKRFTGKTAKIQVRYTGSTEQLAEAVTAKRDSGLKLAVDTLAPAKL